MCDNVRVRELLIELKNARAIHREETEEVKIKLKTKIVLHDANAFIDSRTNTCLLYNMKKKKLVANFQLCV